MDSITDPVIAGARVGAGARPSAGWRGGALATAEHTFSWEWDTSRVLRHMRFWKGKQLEGQAAVNRAQERLSPGLRWEGWTRDRRRVALPPREAVAWARVGSGPPSFPALRRDRKMMSASHIKSHQLTCSAHDKMLVLRKGHSSVGVRAALTRTHSRLLLLPASC